MICNSWNSRKTSLVIGVFITLLGLAVRLHRYDDVPHNYWTCDEYVYTWAGISHFDKGVPESWSFIEAYRNHRGVIRLDKQYPIVKPWLDNPFLASWIYGGFAYLTGERGNPRFIVDVIRIPAILMGTVCVLLIFLFAHHRWGLLAAIFSSTIFATHPHLVTISRLALTENVIVFVSVVVLWLMRSWDSLWCSRRRAVLIGIVAGFAPMAKLPGIFLVLACVALLLYQRNVVAASIVGVIGALMGSIYFVAGFHYDARTFVEVLDFHRVRGGDINLVGIGQLLWPQTLGEPKHTDLWVVFCWLMLAGLYFKDRLMLGLPLVCYMLMMVLSNALGHWYPWYSIPTFPFLALVFGCSFARFFEREDPFYLGFFLFLVVLPICFDLIKLKVISTGNLPFNELTLLGVMGLGLFSLPYVVRGSHVLDEVERKTLAKCVSALLFAVLVAGNLLVVANYDFRSSGRFH